MERENPSSRGHDSDLTGYFALALDYAKHFYKLLFVLGALVSIVVVIYVHLAKPIYMAAAALTPPKDALLDASGLSGDTGNLASIGRRLGLGAGGPTSQSGDTFDEYTRVLQSHRLAEILAKRPDFLSLLFPNEFDSQTGHLKKRAGLVADTVNSVKAVLGLPITQATDEDRVYNFLTDELTISRPSDPSTNISEISLSFDNGPAAEKILDTILSQGDDLMRTDRRQDIAARIRYLQQQLRDVTLDDQRSALTSLLVMQQNVMMIIAADHHYATYIVEPPHTPAKPVWPNIGSVVGLIAFLSVVAWVLAIALIPKRYLARFKSSGGPKAKS